MFLARWIRSLSRPDVVTIHIHECCPPGRGGGRIIPILGPFRDAPATVVKTPEFRDFPLTGDLLMAVTMNSVQQFNVTIKIVNKKGQPASVDGTPEWLSDNTDVLALTPSPDGMSCDVVAVGIPGTAKVQVSADADLGAGVESLVGTLDVSVIAAPATAITLTPGAVVDQP